MLLSLSSMFCCVLVGIGVGQQFYSRAEMVVLGVHGHWLNGIDYLGGSYAKQVIDMISLLTRGCSYQILNHFLWIMSYLFFSFK